MWSNSVFKEKKYFGILFQNRAFVSGFKAIHHPSHTTKTLHPERCSAFRTLYIFSSLFKLKKELICLSIADSPDLRTDHFISGNTCPCHSFRIVTLLILVPLPLSHLLISLVASNTLTNWIFRDITSSPPYCLTLSWWVYWVLIKSLFLCISPCCQLIWMQGLANSTQIDFSMFSSLSGSAFGHRCWETSKEREEKRLSFGVKLTLYNQYCFLYLDTENSTDRVRDDKMLVVMLSCRRASHILFKSFRLLHGFPTTS